MKTSGNTVLITGGSSGIGLALAEKFLQADNQVIITGRDEKKLKRAARQLPRLVTQMADITREEDMRKLAQRVTNVNVLVNNAGVQFNYDFAEKSGAAELIKTELATNLEGPILLTRYFLPQLLRRQEAAIINVTSGLALVPKQSAPIYCAAKAGLHIFSKALRYQLESSNVKLFEVMPPLVDTDMTKGRGKGKIPASQLVDEFWRDFQRSKYEMHIGKVKLLYLLNRLLPGRAERIVRHGV